MSSSNCKLVLGDLLRVICNSENHYTRLFELRERVNKTKNEMIEEDVLLLYCEFLNCRRSLNFPNEWKMFFV